ncbi:hypothetical protein GPECTOR_257g650 [Gonium pectorale]|uniref:COR domain-containing protein n=1 Tax=Gonium pectorale TaxID=33097 RepID=A0A150FW83_GONPE|nr:hypothetical protein GPECTOR_257g650 [Gonium pectorale]|eukprot:KXZ41866.1 hypothetical protein GPECTOR_257g650 [Gonium pectorale]
MIGHEEAVKALLQAGANTEAATKEVYWSTHAFFMVRDALYVTVYSGRDNGKDSVGDFLDRVKLLVPEKTPLLVATRAWEGGFIAQEPPASVLEAHGIKANDIIRLSSLTGQGVDELKHALISKASEASVFSDWLSRANLNVREQVRQMRADYEKANKPPLITLGEFEDMAKRCDLTTPDNRRRCMDRLTDMGELRHFSDVPGLEDVVVIDPRWLADLMSKIVTTDAGRMAKLGMENGQNSRNKGWTSMKALEKVVKSVCPASSSGGSWVDGLVRLMQHCGLVYAAANGMAVIPPMLPDRMTQSLKSHRAALVKQPGSQSGHLPAGPRRWWSAQYEYGRLLDHRLSRLLCRLLLLLPDVEVLDVWRFGARLRRPQGDVLAMTCTRRLDKWMDGRGVPSEVASSS